VTRTICLLTMLMLAAFAGGCTNSSTANDNVNASNQTAQAATSPTTKPGPDNSEVTTSVDANGTRTETRVFKDNPHISKVVVTTRNGQRTVRATSRSGEEREVKSDENVLEATGDKVASAAGFVADKAEDVPGETKSAVKTAGDKAEDVKDKTVSTTKKVGSETADKAGDVKDATVSTSKKVGDKTVEGAKKVGSETKKAVKKVIP